VRRRRAGALAVVALLALAGYLGWTLIRTDRHGAQVDKWSLNSRLLGRSIDEVGVVPKGGGRRPLLVLLHGRGGSPGEMLHQELFDGLRDLGARAPAVVIVNGGDHSYYHDRRDGRWGSYLLREVVPDAVRRLGADPTRIAIGGTSMGGYGALLAASRDDRFCAVGGHSAALWPEAGATAEGAFDDAADYARNDVYGTAMRNPAAWRGMRVWMDVGRDDPFRQADQNVAAALRRGGLRVTEHVWPGAHGDGYFTKHLTRYLAWYGRVLASCRR
jgi:S-formylglutathione hydrolase FrmB